jgi:hypothetical protein
VAQLKSAYRDGPNPLRGSVAGEIAISAGETGKAGRE